MSPPAPQRWRLWTAFLDYCATGEGRTIDAWIGYALSEQECREKCGQALDTFYAKVAECVARWRANIMQGAEHRADIVACSKLDFNYS
jgi:hypothetical protein